VFSFLFWFVFYCLCTYQYCTSSTVFFNPLDVYLSLLTTCVHSCVTCASHNNSSASYYAWSRFLIFSTHHS
jgi:hypothetical protein